MAAKHLQSFQSHRGSPLMAMYLDVIDDMDARDEFYLSALFDLCAGTYFTDFLLNLHGCLDSELL
jgi:hypothetical protein